MDKQPDGHPPAGSNQAMEPQGGDLVRRHHLATRIWHWTNVVTVTIMLMSGLMIFNAHPRLYLGHYGANPDPALIDLSKVNGGIPFPGWITLPGHYSLADARLWHLAFAWVLVLAWTGYLIWSHRSGHLKRDLAPRRDELTKEHFWHEIVEHARLRFPTGAAALHYNLLQKLAYGAVLVVLLPGIITTGLTMSPGVDAGWPGLVDLFGGRQTARTIHFFCAFGLVGFFLVHIAMVVLAGPINEVRSMITGWYRLPSEKGEQP